MIFEQDLSRISIDEAFTFTGSTHPLYSHLGYIFVEGSANHSDIDADWSHHTRVHDSNTVDQTQFDEERINNLDTSVINDEDDMVDPIQFDIERINNQDTAVTNEEFFNKSLLNEISKNNVFTIQYVKNLNEELDQFNATLNNDNILPLDIENNISNDNNLVNNVSSRNKINKRSKDSKLNPIENNPKATERISSYIAVQSLLFQLPRRGPRDFQMNFIKVITLQVSLTYFCPPFKHLLSERLTSLGIMGEPWVPPLNPQRR